MCTFWYLLSIFYKAVDEDSLLGQNLFRNDQAAILHALCILPASQQSAHRVEGNLHRRTENQCPTGGLPEGEGLECGGGLVVIVLSGKAVSCCIRCAQQITSDSHSQ